MIMSPLITFLLLQSFLLNMSDRVQSQTLSDTSDGEMPPQGSSLRNNFQPSLAVVIGMLAVMFSLTFVLLLYAKFCHRATSVHNMTSHHQIQDGLARTRSSLPSTGVDKTVVESLPFFRFSSLRGSKQGLECSVCLAKFQDVEVLRLLPKCKHAFHMDCIDQWLEKHATCPLCRRKVSADDLQLPESGSWRFLSCQSDLNREGSNLELYVEREESRRHGSSRFSFRKLFDKEDELPIQRSDDDAPAHHKFKHRITVVSDVMLKNRWSDLTSSDLMFLNSELLCDASSARFPDDEVTKAEVKDITGLPTTSDQQSRRGVFESNEANYCDDKRSMSEIILHPRLITELSSNHNHNQNENSSSSDSGTHVEEERVRKQWLPIARKTALWFANRESRHPQS